MAGPEAAGYHTSLWTCWQIVDLIRARFDVVYHPDHVGRLLRACGCGFRSMVNAQIGST